MSKKSILAIALMLFYNISFAQNYITLHEDCNYGGKAFFLEAGTYRTYQLKIGNDKLSCLQIPNGMKVTLYENDNYEGRSQTFSSNVACLDPQWNDMASSIVVENANYQSGNPNDYVVFYNDCFARGFSKSLKPGTYTGVELGNLKNNISSFTIFGNLRVRVYVNNETASGYYTTYNSSQTCLNNSFSDKIGSLVIEYNPNSGPGNNNNNNFNNNSKYAVFYTDCNYTGNSIHLLPGYYQAEKLGLFRFDISSIEVSSNLRIKAFMNESLSGSSYTINESNSCLTSSLNNRIGSVIIEEVGFGNNNSYPPVSGNVIIYTDGNYRGQSATLLPGTYSNMAQVNFPNKALSSIKVPAGYRVVIYENENFGGKSYTMTESKTGFGFSNWNDRASSIVVYRER
ncbi:MAG: hypothetical protein WBC06_09985 [Chitinophagaceae bacterium]